MTAAAPTWREKARVWLTLVGSPLLLAVAFIPVVGYFAGARGLEGQALQEAIEPVAVFPVTLGFSAIFLFTRVMARRDGLSLVDLGWKRPGAVLLIGSLVGMVVVGVINAKFIFSRIHEAQPSFDPTLARVSLGAALVTMLVAPLGEDTLYRGYALTVLRGRYGSFPAVVVTSLLYAFLTPAQGLPLVLWAAGFGALLSVIRLATGSLWPVYLVHVGCSLAPKLLA